MKESTPCAAGAASPSQPSVEGDGSLGAGRPFLAAPELGHAFAWAAGGALRETHLLNRNAVHLSRSW